MSGKNIGYIRVSTYDQNTARQLNGIPLDKVFKEHARPALRACIDYVRDGDMLHDHPIDRLARNLQDLLSLVSTQKEKKVTTKFHKEKLEFCGGGEDGKSNAFQELQQQLGKDYYIFFKDYPVVFTKVHQVKYIFIL